MNVIFVYSQALDLVIIRAHHNIMPKASIRMPVSGASNAINGKIGRSACVHRPLRMNWPSWGGERRMSKFANIFDGISVRTTRFCPLAIRI